MGEEERPQLRFLSLFVPDLEAATAAYHEVLGVEPLADAGSAPAAHPFASAGPVVFELGQVSIALYQCDQRATHPGDVGIGVELDRSPAPLAARAEAAGGRVFYGPRRSSAADGRELAVFVLPDRHFFEVLGPRR